MSDKSIEVFFSYAHEDEKLRDELAKHLKLLQWQKVISTWYDREISAGDEWKQEIEKRLNSADVILLLISADFLASDFCWGVELKRAMERHEAGEAHVIPIILREVDWKGATFGKLQALPKNAKPVNNWASRDMAFADIARGIRKAVEGLVNQPPNRNFAKKKILILSANPTGTSKQRRDEAMCEIKEGLQRGKRHEQFCVKSVASKVPYIDIFRSISDYEPQIVHFFGHGLGSEGLVFEDETGKEKLVDAEFFAEHFEQFADIVKCVKCVVLHGCYSKVQARAIATHIDYVVGMSQEIGDEAAIEYVLGFYDAIGNGSDFKSAHEFGCQFLSYRRKGSSDSNWKTPQLLTKKQFYVELRSEKRVDYTRLRNLLAAEKWKEADKETARVMPLNEEKIARWLVERKDIEEFPCADLRTIDQLWVKYSDGRFGFSVQKRIYQSLERADHGVMEALGDHVGWREHDKWLRRRDLTFNLKAPCGHLPRGGWETAGEKWDIKLYDTGGVINDALYGKKPWKERNLWERFLSRYFYKRYD